jgi:hypothetical protein
MRQGAQLPELPHTPRNPFLSTTQPWAHERIQAPPWPEEAATKAALRQYAGRR